jgi:hypothetical protein
MPSSDVGAEASPWLRSDPFARCGDPLAGRDHRGIPYHRDQFAVAAHLIRKTQKPFSSLWYVTRPGTTRLASILVVNETNDAMPLAKSIQIGCSGATVASPSELPQLIHEQGSQPPV